MPLVLASLTVKLQLTCALGSKVSVKLVLDAKSLCHQIISNVAVPNYFPVNSDAVESMSRYQHFNHLFIYVSLHSGQDGRGVDRSMKLYIDLNKSFVPFIIVYNLMNIIVTLL